MSVMIQSMVRLAQREQESSPYPSVGVASPTIKSSTPSTPAPSSAANATLEGAQPPSSKRVKLQMSQSQQHMRNVLAKQTMPISQPHSPSQVSRAPQSHDIALHVSSPSADVRASANQNVNNTSSAMRTFLDDVRSQFLSPMDLERSKDAQDGCDRLLAASSIVQAECRTRLQSSEISMLPSYQHTLPSGFEAGNFLALDVGGSTLRVALVQLNGKQVTKEEIETKGVPVLAETTNVEGATGALKEMSILQTKDYAIDEKVRRLQGPAFFDWMAERIEDMLKRCDHHHTATAAEPLPMGLAWSFPIEQTSPRSGKLLAMGKGFCATHGVEGQDLSALIMRACHERSLPVDLRAIVNDGAATLLAQAYRDPTATRISLICGTGTNAAVFLPVRALADDKYGRRDSAWFDAANHVLVNTELSMVGGGEKPALPRSKWDVQLNAQHRLPDFQPLEYLTTGRYLGEIVRLILVDASAAFGLFGGNTPQGLSEPYTLDTRLLAPFEQDDTPEGLALAATSFLLAHPIPLTTLGQPQVPSIAEWTFVRDVIRLVTHRAAAYLAVALHALWRVRVESEIAASAGAAVDSRVTIACHGTIIEKYPGYRERCQQFLDTLCAAEGHTRAGTILLAVAPESSIFGAAVAVGCLEGWEG